MDRMKQFGRYALMIIVFYIISDVLIYFGLIGMYKNFSGEVKTTSPSIEISEAKATKQTGIIKGKIKNTTNATIDGKYIKIDLFTERNTYLGSKYLKVSNLEKDQEVEFESTFKFANIYRYEISLVDKEREYTDQELISDDIKTMFLTGAAVKLLFL